MKDSTLQILLSALSPVVMMVLGWMIKRSQDRQAAAATLARKEQSEKIDEYRKEVNGHMGTLIETTKKLAGAEATLVEKEKGEVKAADLKAASAPSAEIKVETVTVEAKTAEVKADTVTKGKK